MTRRARRLTVVWAAFAAGLAAAAACSFPDVSFAPEEGGTSSEAGTSDAPVVDGGKTVAEGGEGGKQVINPDVDPEGGAADAAVIPDGGQQQIEAGVGCCDCDNDNFRDDAGGACGDPLGDCDDLNAFVNPGAPFYLEFQWKSAHQPAYDWNCDKTVVKQLPHDVNCGQLGNCTAQGFAGDPGCGESGKYIHCKENLLPIGLLCTEDKPKEETRVQGCR